MQYNEINKNRTSFLQLPTEKIYWRPTCRDQCIHSSSMYESCLVIPAGEQEMINSLKHMQYN